MGRLNELARTSYENARNHGFYDPPPSFASRISLIHSELSEALEDWRGSRMALTKNEKGKPEGFPTELADTVIRIADLCGFMEINLDDCYRTAVNDPILDLLSERATDDLIAEAHLRVSRAFVSRANTRAVSSNLAEVVVICGLMAAREGADLQAAIVAKAEYNLSRPYRHGHKRA